MTPYRSIALVSRSITGAIKSHYCICWLNRHCIVFRNHLWLLIQWEILMEPNGISKCDSSLWYLKGRTFCLQFKPMFKLCVIRHWMSKFILFFYTWFHTIYLKVKSKWFNDTSILFQLTECISTPYHFFVALVCPTLIFTPSPFIPTRPLSQHHKSPFLSLHWSIFLRNQTMVPCLLDSRIKTIDNFPHCKLYT